MAHSRLDSLKEFMFSLLNYPQHRREDVGAVWFGGYPLGDRDIPNQVVRGNHFSCLVED
jgi:hypothetical protein